jgi:hypothetical protein
VTDAVPESCIIHKRDVSKHEQARVERTRANYREPATIEKLCSDMWRGDQPEAGLSPTG